jgi:hypothetical protein
LIGKDLAHEQMVLAALSPATGPSASYCNTVIEGMCNRVWPPCAKTTLSFGENLADSVLIPEKAVFVRSSFCILDTAKT